MNAKEQAVEMYEKYRTYSSDLSIEERHRTSIVCCHYTLHKILETCISYDNYNACEFSQRNYWIDVQTEIRKINDSFQKEMACVHAIKCDTKNIGCSFNYVTKK